MKKIAIITHWHPFTGGGKYAFNIFDRLSKGKKFKTNLIYHEYDSNRVGYMDGVIKIRSNSFNFLNKTIYTYYDFTKHIPDGYDIYHATNQFLAKTAHYRKPCVISHLDLIPILFSKGKFAPIGFFLKRLLKYYKEAEHIIAISELVRDELLQFMNIPDEKISVIYPGFDEKIYKPINKETARKKLGLPLDKKIILNVGSEEPDKGVPFLLEILKWKKYMKFFKDVVLIRIGSSNPKWDAVKKSIGIIQLKGIPEEQMPLYYSAADVFAAPFNYGAGFVYPPLEAIACGIPALVSNLQFDGYMNVPQNLFADMLENILEDEKFRKGLVSKSLESSKSYTLTKEIQEINKIYKRVLE